MLEGLPVLDREQDAEIGAFAPFELLLQTVHVGRPPHERVADEIGMAGDEIEVLEILAGERRLDHAFHASTFQFHRHRGDSAAAGIHETRKPSSRPVAQAFDASGRSRRERVRTGRPEARDARG